MVLTFVFVLLKILGRNIYFNIAEFSKKAFTEYPGEEGLFTFNGMSALYVDVLIVILKTAGPVLAIALLTGIMISYAQVGFIFTTETLKLKLDRINPLNGFKRIFSMQGAAELVKALLKIAVIGYTAYACIKSESVNVLNLMNRNIAGVALYIVNTILNTAVKICVVLIILGVLDYLYQWFRYEKGLRMSKQEIKEEYKQTEGNPEVKSKIKQKQKQISMRRMLHEVPKADVVITNPTHYAVAIKYDSQLADAPVVTAKGLNFIAQRIKDVAGENGVEIVENKELARTLYDTVEIGDAIPPELYQAVAEILAFVYSIKGKAGEGRSDAR
jgi:flagellar biosynthetic protein FlhB